MQYIIEIRPDQDVQFLLTLLEKMQIVYRPIDLPNKAVKKPAQKGEKAKTDQPVLINISDTSIGAFDENPTLKPSERLAGKLSSETAKALLAHIEESRNEPALTFSQKYYGKLSAETADRLLEYVEQSRNEWERTF